jgi:hypothetical protein
VIDPAGATATLRSELAGIDGWLVGGAVRDAVLGRPVLDLDVVVPGDPRAVARARAAASGGAVFALSERHGAWRVVEGDRTVDVTGAHGSIAEDLARRDLTVNAIAVAIGSGAVLDPFRGGEDLAAGTLRLVSERAFHDDPLRLLRLVRLASELELAVDDATVLRAAADAALLPNAAPERRLAELQRTLLVRDPIDAFALLERCGLLTVALPEVAALRGVLQSRFHHLDVLDHTLHTVDAAADIADNLGAYFDDPGAELISRTLDEPVDGTIDQRGALRWAALLHDIGKPLTRSEASPGAIRFLDHERVGRSVAGALLADLHASASLRALCEVLVGTHLRLGFLARESPLPARVAYRYALATRPSPAAAIVLSLAERLATRGPATRLRGVRRHAGIAREMANAVAALGPVPPRLLLGADELAEAIGLAPGPALGRLVAAVQEEQAAGAVTSRDDAIAFARSWLAAEG